MRKADYEKLAVILREQITRKIENNDDAIRKESAELLAYRCARCLHVDRDVFLKACGLS